MRDNTNLIYYCYVIIQYKLSNATLRQQFNEMFDIKHLKIHKKLKS